MKKFYAFVCAVAVALTASAGPIDFAPKAKKDITKLELSTKSFKTNLTNAKRVKRASRISANDAALEGDKMYLEESYSLLTDSVTGKSLGWQVDSPVNLLRAENGTYTIEYFYGMEGINLTGGVYDAVEGTLTFQPQTVVSGLSEMGAPYESMVIAVCDEDDQLTEEPIVFDVDIPSRNLYYQGEAENNKATTYVGIVALDTDNEIFGFLDYLYAIDLNQVNGMSIFNWADSEQNQMVKEKVYVYNEVVEGNLVTTGLFGTGFVFPVTFTLNQETNTAVADNQVIASYNDGNGGSLDFMFFNLVFNEDSTKVSVGEPVETFEIIPQEGAEGVMTYIYKDYTSVLAPYNGQNYVLVDGGIIYGFQILYVGDIFDPTGIHDVQLDKNTNAPVEYYNLQGIRVSEPTKGGIYIRRQGNVSTKIMR